MSRKHRDRSWPPADAVAPLAGPVTDNHTHLPVDGPSGAALFAAYLRTVTTNDDRLSLVNCGLSPLDPAQLPIGRETDNRQAI